MRSITDRLDRIDELRTSLLGETSGLDLHALTARPEPYKWSILEILEHLVRSETDVMRGLFEEGPLSPKERTLGNRLAFLAVMFVLRYPIRVRTPSSGMVPRGKWSWDEISLKWDENHKTIRRFAEDLDEEGSRQAVFAHPVSGPLTPDQAILMLEVHMRRHARQVRRMIASLQDSRGPDHG
jgi:hypothetical protein